MNPEQAFQLWQAGGMLGVIGIVFWYLVHRDKQANELAKLNHEAVIALSTAIHSFTEWAKEQKIRVTSSPLPTQHS